jgi:hypothetical protein
LYPKESPLAKGEIEMKYMTAKEEDILTNSNYLKNGTVIDNTECNAATGSGTSFAKLITNWMITLQPNDEVALYVTNKSNSGNITLLRARLVASTVGKQGSNGTSGSAGTAGSSGLTGSSGSSGSSGINGTSGSSGTSGSVNQQNLFDVTSQQISTNFARGFNFLSLGGGTREANEYYQLSNDSPSTGVLGTGVSTVAVSSAFNSTYDNYRVEISFTSGNFSGDIYFRFGSVVTGYYGNNIDMSPNSSTVTGASINNADSIPLCLINSTNGGNVSMDIMSPNLAKRSSVTAAGVGFNTTGNSQRWTNAYENSNTQHTAFSIIVGNTLTGGEIRVYGYQNS